MTASSQPPSTNQPARWTIRPAHKGDIAAIAQLGSNVFAASFGHSVTADELAAFLAESYSLEAITRDLHDAARDVVVAVPDGPATDPMVQKQEILGFAYLTRGTTEPCLAAIPNAAQLQRIYVASAAQGQGLGAALAGRVADLARAQGFQHLWLGVWEENKRAQRAYATWGYRQVGKKDFTVGSVVQRDDIMVKAL